MHPSPWRASSALALLALAFLTVRPAASQDGGYASAPGYAVTAAGDTLRGTLALLPDVLATRQVWFRGAQGSARYEPRHLLGYGFDGGDRYVRRLLPPAEGLEPELIFLRTLVEGELSLFAFAYAEALNSETLGGRQRTLERFALGDSSSQVRPVYVRRERVQTEGRVRLREDRQYVRALAVAFVRCPQEQARVESIPFRQRDLTEAVLRYNACVGAPAVAVVSGAEARRADLPVSVRAHISGGAYAADASFLSEPATGTLLRLGAELIVRPLLISQRSSIPIGLFFATAAMGKASVHSVYEGSDFARPRVGLSLGVRQSFALGGMEPFLGVGLHSAYFPSEDRKEILFPNPSPGVYRLPSWESGHHLEIGLSTPGSARLARAGGGLRYERSGMQHPNPFLRDRSVWQSRSASVFVTYQL
jgi:hypothetical protein